jgi:hypothetical protein
VNVGDIKRALYRAKVAAAFWRRAPEREAAKTAGTTRVAQASRRLLIAPVNSAGQGYAWARAAERLPDTAAANFAYRDPGDVFGFPADHAVPTSLFVSNRDWQRRQRAAIESRFTHVIVESGRQILGTQGSPAEQVRELGAHGIRVALLWHGSDIRTPSVHAEHEPDSPFRLGRYKDTAKLEETALRNHRLIAETGLPTFVSTPDLLAFVPSATWLPVVVDPDRWAAAAASPALTRERPVVVHAPSNAGLKGSELIADTMRRLHEEGVVDYREIHGVPADRMPAFYGEADIVLDQFALGIYGVATCEALAAGRLVVSHVGAGVRTEVVARTGRELPVVETSAAALEATLRDVVADPSRYRDIATRGPEFVRDVHDGRRSALALAPFLGLAPDETPRSAVGDL